MCAKPVIFFLFKKKDFDIERQSERKSAEIIFFLLPAYDQYVDRFRQHFITCITFQTLTDAKNTLPCGLTFITRI